MTSADGARGHDRCNRSEVCRPERATRAAVREPAAIVFHSAFIAKSLGGHPDGVRGRLPPSGMLDGLVESAAETAISAPPDTPRRNYAQDVEACRSAGGHGARGVQPGRGEGRTAGSAAAGGGCA